MADLKPCPFCGGEAETENRHNRYTDWWEVKCTDCNASLNERYEYEFEAVAAWNTRKPMEAVVAELEKNGQRMSEAKSCVPFGKHSPANHIYYKAISVKKAIEIVRNGGKE